MDVFFWIMAATFIVSLLGLSGVVTLWLSERNMKTVTRLLTAFAIGGLLGGAFFHLLPEAAGHFGSDELNLLVLAGFMIFLVIESYLHWSHCETCEEEKGIHPYSYLMLIGDAVHNIVDGLVVAAGFFVSIPFGIVTTIAIIGHEIPDELGVYGVLVHGGFERKKALFYSLAAQSTGVIGGLLGYFLSSMADVISQLLIPFAAGGFIYIAAADLIPEMHKEGMGYRLVALLMIFLGLGLMYALKVLGFD